MEAYFDVLEQTQLFHNIHQQVRLNLNLKQYLSQG